MMLERRKKGSNAVALRVSRRRPARTPSPCSNAVALLELAALTGARAPGLGARAGRRCSSIIYGVPALFLKGGCAAFFFNAPGSAFEFLARRSSFSFGVRVFRSAFEFHLRRSSFSFGVRVSFTAFEFHLRRSSFICGVRVSFAAFRLYS